MIRGVLFAGLFVVSAACPPALADTDPITETVKGRDLVYPIPATFCPLDESQPSDAATVSMMSGIYEPINRLAAVFVACGERAAMRDGTGGMRNYATIYLTHSVVNGAVPVQRAPFVSYMRVTLEQQGAPLSEAMTRDLADRLDEMGLPISVSEPKFVGLLAGNDEFVMFGILLKVTNAEREGVVAGAIASTVINGVPINVALYTPHENPESLGRLIPRLEAYVDRLLRVNTLYGGP